MVLGTFILAMGKFTELLEKNFKEDQEQGCCPAESKMAYAGSHIFDFTTYDEEADVLFAKNMIEVLKCILDKEPFEYQKDEKQYINYLTMVNMPFLTDKLEWGGSIRGAWFDNWQEYEVDFIKIEKQELEIFIADLIEWANCA